MNDKQCKNLESKIDRNHMSLMGQLWILAGMVFLVGGANTWASYAMMAIGGIAAYTAYYAG